MKPIVILGTSRSTGETRRAVDLAFADAADVFDLNDFTIKPYDYEYRNQNDDFARIVDDILPRKTIVLATPVYWYAMSAQLKTFVDRLSDLVRVEKTKGRSLAGKDLYVIATGTGAVLPGGFEVPFINTCKYFDMNYCGI